MTCTNCVGGNDCAATATCTSIPGSYNCTCNLGYAGNGSFCAGKLCVLVALSRKLIERAGFVLSRRCE